MTEIPKEIEEIEDEEIEDEDLDVLPFSEYHDLLVARGNEIGYMKALLEHNEKEWLTEERLHKLQDTLFADYLHKELESKHIFKKALKREDIFITLEAKK